MRKLHKPFQAERDHLAACYRVALLDDVSGVDNLTSDASIAAGLKFRPIKTTAEDTLEWYNGLDEDSRFRRLAGIAPEREAEVLKAWHESHG